MTTYFTSKRAEKKALALCGRSYYKRDLLEGRQRWSGSDLKGKAKQFGSSYARQRQKLMQDLKDAGLQPVELYVKPHGLKVVII